jgi:hypothetical protein
MTDKTDGNGVPSRTRRDVVARFVAIMMACVLAGTGLVAPTVGATSECPVGWSAAGQDESLVCDNWVSTLPDMCALMAKYDNLAHLNETLSNVLVPGNEATLEICGSTYQVPRGAVVELCRAYHEMVGQLEQLSLESPSSEPVVEYALGELEGLRQTIVDALGSQSCTETPFDFDPCAAATGLSSGIRGPHQNEELLDVEAGGSGTLGVPDPSNLDPFPGWDELYQSLNRTVNQGPSIAILEEGMNYTWSVSQQAYWINYQPVGDIYGKDTCPMPWAQAMSFGMPDCMPPDNMDLQAAETYIVDTFGNCGFLCQTAPGLCNNAQMYQEYSWAVSDAFLEVYGRYSFEEFWKKVQLYYEQPVLIDERAAYASTRQTALPVAIAAGGGDSGNSEGKWRIDVVPGAGGLVASSLGGTDVGAGFALYKIAGHEIGDKGIQTQSASRSGPDSYAGTEVASGIEKPPDYVQKAGAAALCAGAVAGAYKVATGAWTAFGWAGPWGFAAAAVVSIGAGIVAGMLCTAMALYMLDEGSYECWAKWTVTHGGQDYQSTIAQVGPVSITGSSASTANHTRTWEYHITNTTSYEGGKQACEEAYNKAQAEMDTYQAQWGPETQGTGNASLTLTVELLPGIHSTVRGAIYNVDPDAGLWFDAASGSLIFGCNQLDCPLNLQVIVESTCGTLTTHLGNGGHHFVYEDPGGCTTVTVIVHDVEISGDVPLSINLDQNAQGWRHG